MGTGKTRRNAKYRNAFEMALAPKEKKLNADLNKYKDFVQEVTSVEAMKRNNGVEQQAD